MFTHNTWYILSETQTKENHQELTLSNSDAADVTSFKKLFWQINTQCY